MDRDTDLYKASLLMYSASEFLYAHKPELSGYLLDRVKEIASNIKVNQKMIDEVAGYANQIRTSIELNHV